MKIVDQNSNEFSEIVKLLPYPFSGQYAAFEGKFGFNYVVLSNEYGTYIPLKISKRLVFHVGIFMHAPINIRARLSVEDEKAFLEETCHFAASQLKCIRIEPSSTISVYQAYPENSAAIELGLFTVDLSPPEENIFAAFNSNYRNEIRNAEKSGIEIRTGKQEIPNFYNCYAETHQRQGIAHENFTFFQNFYNTIGEEGVLCATAYYNNTLEAGVFIAFSQFGAYYLYAGSSAKTLLKGSTKKILWECMKAMKARGINRFVLGGARYKNVEGTKYEGIQNFKRRFGAMVTDGYLWKRDLNNLQCKLYDFLFWVRCRLRGKAVPKDIIDSQLLDK